MSSNLLNPGERLGKYEVLAHIANGGMGTVYKAQDVELRRTIALKVLPAHLARNVAVLERFRREARYAARLSHPNIVTLFECGHDSEQDLHYLALEFIDGIDLLEYIERKVQLQPEEARRILVQAAQALDHAHQNGLVHRDIKPSNFLLARAGKRFVVKMTDLGLAWSVDDDDFKVTRDGSTVGTLDYMSPEQARDSRATDIRSDIYSLGCTAYHMLAGKAPFADGGLAERVYKHMETPPDDVREFNANVSEEFWAILWKMLAKNPADRYSNPAELLENLKRTPRAAARTKAEMPQTTSHPRRRKTDPVTTPLPSSPTVRCDPLSDVEVPRNKRRSRQEMPDDVTTLITPEQMQAAAAFHERAVEVMEEGGKEYARQLLDSCLKLDPFTLAHRKTLRELNRKATGGTLGRWLGSLNVLALKAKMRLARSNGDWRKVLEHGEQVLARHPADAEAHGELASAAEALGLPNLAMWFVEQGRDLLPDNAHLMRVMAQLYENRSAWKRAILLWDNVRKLEPDDPEARRKIDDLTVKDHLAKPQYRR